MTRIVWLASYPKSGNTWLRALLTNYRRDGASPASINQLDGGSRGLTRSIVDDCLGVDSSLLGPEQLQRCRPRVYEQLAAESADAPLLIKVHDAYRAAIGESSPFETPASSGVIYIARNPLAVAVSYAHHRDKSLDDTIATMADGRACMDGTNSPGQTIPEYVSSWSQHVFSWLDQDRIPVALVRFEDLCVEPHAALEPVIRFLDWPVDHERLARAVSWSSFAELQSQEAATGFREKQPTAPSFFREGKADGWSRWLSQPQAARVYADHASGLRRLRYIE